MFVDYAGLFRAIQTLDEDENSPIKIRAALAFLLEFVWFLDTRSDPADNGSQPFIVICEGRILGCIKRFVSKRKRIEDKLQSISTGCSCHQKLVRLAIVVILFGICCHSSMAPIVIKEGLHSFLTELCLSQGSRVTNEHLATGHGAKSFHETSAELIDPHDMLLAVDPFDWCYQSICVRIVEDHRTSVLVPIGARSLAHLLRGEPIPTDEIEERNIIFNRYSATSGSRNKPYSGRKVKNDLPSIFDFSRNKTIDDIQETIKCMHSTPVWLIALSKNTICHWALRSLIVMLLHLQSSLRKHLIAEGDLIVAFVGFLYLDSWNTADSKKRQSKLPIHQTIAFQRSALCNMAIIGFSIILDEEITLLRTRYPQVHFLAKEIRKKHPSRNRKQANTKLRAIEKTGERQQLLNGRLVAARAVSRQELSGNHAEKQDLELSRYRQSLRLIFERTELLRRGYDKGLDLLYFGRSHPIPDQVFVDWILSFQTMETIEREQQHQDQLRQRHFLEMQYRQQKLTRKESNERTEMKMNDINVRDINEYMQQEQRRHQFLDLQTKMKRIAAATHNETGWFAARILNGTYQLSDTAISQKEPSTHKRQCLHIQAYEREKERLRWITLRKEEAKELERMSKEDLYYVERLQKMKEMHRAIEFIQVNPIEQHQHHIERRRKLDFEMKLMTKERQAMYTEDLFGRQYQLADIQRRKWNAQNEWRARKTMLAEDKESHAHWRLLENERIIRERNEFKHQRAIKRQQRRQQKQFEDQVSRAWIENWDENGNKYYYNHLAGCSQWENPFI